MEEHEARVNVTYSGANGDLPDPVPFDTTDVVIRGLVEEAIRTGTLPGVITDVNVKLTDFVVDRFVPNETREFNLIQLRPKTPFGA
jgi:hypothetical protein